MESKTVPEFVKVASTTEVPEGKMKMVQIAGHQLCLANIGGKFYAIGNQCTHVGGPLAQGSLKDYIVTCPLHGSQFDIRNGQAKRGPAVKPEPTYEVKVEGNNVLARPA